MLRIEHLEVGHLPALTLEVGDGRCLALEGPSGSGKTRLLRAIADLDPAPGQVFLDGQERMEMPAPQWRRMVRYATAEPQWWTETARAAFSDAGGSDRAVRIVESLGLDEAIVDRPIVELSTGERQRLALVRTFLGEPRVLLLDEPTSSLDIASAALVGEAIKYQMLAGRIVIVASHDRALIGRIATERLVLPRAAPTSIAPPPAEAEAPAAPAPAEPSASADPESAALPETPRDPDARDGAEPQRGET